MIKAVLPLSFIIGTRFFGLFIVLPVLSLYALELQGANEFLVGLLVGVYALTQMALQVPFGVISDKIGRKKTMLIGLIIFIIGSFVCSYANDIYTMMFGRLLQGAGAIGAVATAMISDFINEENRGKAMAVMGSFIGLSFAASLVLSPLMSAKFGLSSLFDLSAILSFVCIVLLFSVVPKEHAIHHENTKTPLKMLLKEKNLALMNLTNCMQKMLMSVAFLSIPLMLVNEFNYPSENLWHVYVSSMVLGFIAMGLSGSLGEKRGLSKEILLLGVVFFILSYVIFAFANSAFVFMVGVVIFFIGFNLHEPIMQSCASKFAKVNEKGAALGIFNSFGYFGSFLGGVVGGYFLHHFSLSILALVLVTLSLIWLFLLFFLQSPSEFKNLYLSLDTQENLSIIKDLKGVLDVYKNSKFLVIKYNKKITNEEEILAIIKT
ncbi:MFS transporter [Campylobacter insulaenigrae]|uniref:MFS transporter n=1 Tax=Campylobacter insulaenigrae TaxID=260714 RepID=UPI0021525160|nr:MFS transporter [Campylobacter insulaenigrae]MCR6574124.1 MFS transporter [Campylobacter insulaenigrae]MCR6575121.1 MFS transporter [Campylobacter insulaenigrae]MCR6580073.1 MFS transporter [Campylobacter insulaenigrae]MCR6584274.1 MFS transporter [Campylobacter insulaenigrae]MCR6586028.1 MFS transporter [Campylobacter insulaenigrae]